MYSSESDVGELRFFADEVARLSDGEVRVRIVSGWGRATAIATKSGRC